MNSSAALYKSLDAEFARTIAGGVAFSEKAQIKPVEIPLSLFIARQKRLKYLQSFLETVLSVFHDAIRGRYSDELKHFLLNEVPECYGVEFHRRLPEAAWTIPQFFRTDEATTGQIFELQCPGSGWGDLQLFRNAYIVENKLDALINYQPSKTIWTEINALSGSDCTSVLHLLDNSSNPMSMKYLIATTQPPLRYWGYDPSVKNGECQFVRSHSFFGLLAENLFTQRLRDVVDGLVRFDLPPILVFDQKMPLCLPFLDETRSLFDDTSRELFCYSYPLTDSGFRDISGEWVSIEDFVKRPARQRRYFLKYAGCDTGTNWGSRGVYRLSDKDAEPLIRQAVKDSKRKRFWLIQPEIKEKEWVEYFERKSEAIEKRYWHVKHSCFYGPSQLIGLRTMHRKQPKVHGQEDTVVGLAVPGLLEENK